MKLQILVIISAIFVFVFSGVVKAQKIKYVFVAGDASANTIRCIQAGENDLSKLRRSLPFSHTRKRALINNLTCNNLPINQFAARFGAADTAYYLNRLTHKKNRLELDKVSITDLASNDDEETIIKTIMIASN
ncbi:hypothetical protein ND16A_2948 [Thalassotalea sp. ND16A]|nr:hypothetical protein ND16A_2948 [Thalassotalea sp. ND16A]